MSRTNASKPSKLKVAAALAKGAATVPLHLGGVAANAAAYKVGQSKPGQSVKSGLQSAKAQATKAKGALAAAGSGAVSKTKQAGSAIANSKVGQAVSKAPGKVKTGAVNATHMGLSTGVMVGGGAAGGMASAGKAVGQKVSDAANSAPARATKKAVSKAARKTAEYAIGVPEYAAMGTVKAGLKLSKKVGLRKTDTLD